MIFCMIWFWLNVVIGILMIWISGVFNKFEDLRHSMPYLIGFVFLALPNTVVLWWLIWGCYE